MSKIKTLFLNLVLKLFLSILFGLFICIFVPFSLLSFGPGPLGSTTKFFNDDVFTPVFNIIWGIISLCIFIRFIIIEVKKAYKK